ncbi:MAG: hypothetical protein Kow0099_15790 [Candidatus Abyssubacteria bacterium]
MLFLMFLIVWVGLEIITNRFEGTPTYPIDSYFYLSKAEQLAGGNGLVTNWNDGFDRKYFPGYSLLLAATSRMKNSVILLQSAAYLACGVLLGYMMLLFNFERPLAFLAMTALWGNPISLKWFSLPMAEGAALTLCLISAVLFFASRGYLGFFLACAVGGLAVITRMEAVFLLPVFGGYLFFEKRERMKWPIVATGTALFMAPLVAYWLWVRSAIGESPAYVKEFLHTLRGTRLLENLAYNIWVPFAFMHRPDRLVAGHGLISTPGFAAIVWFAVGEFVFLIGLVWAVSGKLNKQARVAAWLFLAYAFLHSFWYYRYERFMMMALPMAVIVWAAAVAKLGSLLKKPGNSWLVVLAQVMIATSGLYLGNHYSKLHIEELRADTEWLQFQDIARIVNRRNTTHSPVLADLGPHLAYYLDAHTYLDTAHGNYWQRAFPAERTVEEMERLGIELVVTRKDIDQWLEEHRVPLSARDRFKLAEILPNGVTLLEFRRARSR